MVFFDVSYAELSKVRRCGACEACEVHYGHSNETQCRGGVSLCVLDDLFAVLYRYIIYSEHISKMLLAPSPVALT